MIPEKIFAGLSVMTKSKENFYFHNFLIKIV